MIYVILFFYNFVFINYVYYCVNVFNILHRNMFSNNNIMEWPNGSFMHKTTMNRTRSDIAHILIGLKNLYAIYTELT